jgi:hypothetical protein
MDSYPLAVPTVCKAVLMTGASVDPQELVVLRLPASFRKVIIRNVWQRRLTFVSTHA